MRKLQDPFRRLENQTDEDVEATEEMHLASAT